MEVSEKPLQKLSTAGAERVPPAPWVNMKGGWLWDGEDGGVFDGAY